MSPNLQLTGAISSAEIHQCQLWAEDPNPLLVIKGGGFVDRTSVGLYTLKYMRELGIISKAGYWTEWDYVSNRKTLSSYEDFAKKFKDDTLIEAFYDYERKFYGLEAREALFVDCIGANQLWPSDFSPLVNLIRDRVYRPISEAVWTVISVEENDFVSSNSFFMDLIQQRADYVTEVRVGKG